MKKFKIGYIFIAILLVVFILRRVSDGSDFKIGEDGVSRELADMRASVLTDVEYKLHFNLSEKSSEAISYDENGWCSVEILFNMLDTKNGLLIDFKAPFEHLGVVRVNGDKVRNVFAEFILLNEHIVIDAPYLKKGANSIKIDFVPPDKSLNRREDFIYTLLVPDRARTLFPLFDQPNIKAKYTLSLDVPKDWVAVGNSPIVSEKIDDNGDRKVIYFEKTEPISSYLFSFVAGVFDVVSKTHNGREHKIYHRENDPNKLSQLDDIYDELFHSLDWLEDYTDIKYPFSKYDLILIPGFQYGGMEHVGATIYNASTMFLSPTPTINERLSRAKLIAHETAHMWFGDYVTMEWFDDVWTKEVFANYFAAKIIAPLFPNMSSNQGMLNYFAAAFSEDRTHGAQPIKQNLDNLKYAGLVYNNIIYNKSPLIFNMIAEMMGEDAFKKSIRQYLKKFAYDCATWDELVMIFDENSDKNITDWSRNWMYQSGMPTVEMTPKGRGVAIVQSDPKGRDILWRQKLSFMAIDSKGGRAYKEFLLDGKDAFVELDFVPQVVIPNSSGHGYAYFKLNEKSANWLLNNFNSLKNSTEKRSALILLYENVLNKNIATDRFIGGLLPLIKTEQNPLIFSTMINYIVSSLNMHIATEPNSDIIKQVDRALWEAYENHTDKGSRLVAFKAIYSTILSDNTADKLYLIWHTNGEGERIKIGERDMMALSLQLAVNDRVKADYVVNLQKSRIVNPDTKREFEFVSKAVAASREKREEFFTSLLDVRSRGVESWVEKSMLLLTHKKVDSQEKIGYIRPALDKLSEIQKTGDIFFPQVWCRALLSSSYDREIYNQVRSYLADNPDMRHLLKSKILISSDMLFRIFDDYHKEAKTKK